MPVLTERLLSRAGVSLIVAVAAAWPSGASAVGTNGPGWAITSVALPTNFSVDDTHLCESEGVCDAYVVTVVNTGTTPSSGPVVVKDTLPAGVVLNEIARAVDTKSHADLECITEPAPQCTDANPVPPGDALAITITVTASGSGAASVTNHATVEGGEAAGAATSGPSTVPNTVNGEPPSFGIQDFSIGVHDPSGASDTQAGDHPGALTANIHYTSKLDSQFGTSLAVQEPKTEIVDFPVGFVGSALAAGQCPESTLLGTNSHERHCPADSQVGTVAVDKEDGAELFKVYNVVPEAGYPAMFGFEIAEVVVIMRARIVPTSSGYALSVSAPYVPRSTFIKVTGLSLTFFGDPAEGNGGGSSPAAFFTNPTDCAAGPQTARLEMNSWVNPRRWMLKEVPMYKASPTQGVSG